MEELEAAKTLARLRNDSLAFMRYDALRRELADALENNGFSRRSDSKSAGFYQTMSLVISKIRVTEGKLREVRENGGDKKEEERLNKELTEYLNQFQQIGAERYLNENAPDSSNLTSDALASAEIENYFAMHKVPRSISEIEARNRSLQVLKEKMSREKQLVQSHLATIDELMVKAKERNNATAILKLEYEKNKLSSLYYRLSDYEVILYSDQPVENYVDLDTWGDFASYGRNNINYVLNSTKGEQINDIAKAISQIDKILLTRKKNYEQRIIEIEHEIEMKERDIREKELAEAREQTKQFFEKEYFQLKETEKPENDPFDYKDVVPEVIVIESPAPVQEQPQEPTDTEEEEAPPVSTGNAAPSDSANVPGAVPATPDGAKSDSTGSGGGGGQSDEETAFMKSPEDNFNGETSVIRFRAELKSRELENNSNSFFFFYSGIAV